MILAVLKKKIAVHYPNRPLVEFEVVTDVQLHNGPMDQVSAKVRAANIAGTWELSEIEIMPKR